MIELCIIGFGVSGIAVGRRAKQNNINFVVLEKNKDLGGSWYEKSYPGVKLQTHKKTYSFSDMNYKENVSNYPTGEEVLEYLKEYSIKNDLLKHVKFNCNVLLTKNTNNIWHIKYKHGKEIKLLKSKFLCICSGFYTKPKMPQFKDINNFKGEIKYIKDWGKTGKESIKSFKDKNVLVIGNGPSGLDMACLASKHTDNNVTLLFRTDRWIYKRTDLSIDFIINKFSLNLSKCLNGISPKLFLFCLHVYNIYYFFRLYLKGYKLDWWCLPKNITNRHTINMNDEIFDLITKDKVHYKKGEIIKFNEKTIEIKIKNQIKTFKTDLLILATGYENDIKFMNQSKIPENLYNRILDINQPTCGYIGFLGTLNWIQTSDLQARWFIEYIKGNIKYPSKEKQKNYFMNEQKFYTKHKNIDYHDMGYRSYDYCDQLAKDLNLKFKSKDKKFKHYFQTLDSDEYT